MFHACSHCRLLTEIEEEIIEMIVAEQVSALCDALDKSKSDLAAANAKIAELESQVAAGGSGINNPDLEARVNAELAPPAA
jgi:hypothetical protein